MSAILSPLGGDALLLALALCSALLLPLALAWYLSAPRAATQQPAGAQAKPPPAP